MARCIIAGVLVTYLLAVFQATLGARLALWGVAPDLLFVWTVCVGLLGGSRAGTAAGFGAGLLEGALQQSGIASLAISKGLSGLAAGLLAARMFRENWLVPVVCAAGLTVLDEAVFLGLSRHAAWDQAGRTIGLRMAYHAVLSPFVFALLVRARRAMVGHRGEAG
jgi:rod shape-determining protein MreD